MRIGRLLALLSAFLLIPGVSLADSPPPFPDFQAKRLKPPTSGVSKRINVQIEERANPAVAPPRAAASTVLAQPNALEPSQTVSLYDWFWSVVPAQTDAPGPGRLQDALEVIATPNGVAHLPPPRLQALQDIATRYGRDILLSTIGTDVSPAMVLSVIYTESSGNPTALSGAGAAGLMQLMPATVDRFNVSDALQPADNIKGGVAFLDVLLKKYNGDPILALAGYNAGEGALAEFAGVPPYPETLNYVPRVLSAFTVARGLCTTPPLLASDPCVFRSIAN